MPTDPVAVVRVEAPALADAVRDTPLDGPVPTCPGWTVARLLGHVGRVHRWATVAVTGGGEPPGALERPPEDPEAILAWYEAGIAPLVAALESTDPGAPAWNFAGAPPVARFWPRRQANETLVHRWDAEAAAARPRRPVAPDVAADGIDELLDVLLPPRLRERDGIDIGGSLHLHCTDVEGEWTLRTDDGLYRVERGHAKGDAAVRGPAETLLAVLWHRTSVDEASLESFGNTEVFERWLDFSAF